MSRASRDGEDDDLGPANLLGPAEEIDPSEFLEVSAEFHHLSSIIIPVIFLNAKIYIGCKSEKL